MSANTICLLAFISTLLALCNAQCDRYYTCDPSDSSKFTWGTTELTCPGTKVCNTKYVIDNPNGVDPAPTTGTCFPCLEGAEACQGAAAYTCSGTNQVTINAETYSCPATYLCNNNFENGCDPCYREICPDTAWTCGPEADDVTTASYRGKCVNGICKVVKYGPCNEPCEVVTGTRSAKAFLKITKKF